MEKAAQLAQDLEYLRQEAFEFILTVNPEAGCFVSIEEYANPGAGMCSRDWVTEDQRLEARRTGKVVEGQVYPNGSVSFYQFSGTDLADVVRACAKVCREERERWARSHGGRAPSTGLKVSAPYA